MNLTTLRSLRCTVPRVVPSLSRTGWSAADSAASGLAAVAVRSSGPFGSSLAGGALAAVGGAGHVLRRALWGVLAGAQSCALVSGLMPSAACAAALQLQAQGREGQALADAVFVLEPLANKLPPPAAAGVEIVQEGRQFLPLVSVVPVGTRISFPNRDRVLHHVYSFSEPKKFEIKLYSGKPAAPIEFDRAGLVVLGCNIHDTMVGWIVVSDSPWAGKTGADGGLLLADVPAGAYRLRSWHPDLPPGTPWPEQALTMGVTAMRVSVRLPAGLK